MILVIKFQDVAAGICLFMQKAEPVTPASFTLLLEISVYKRFTKCTEVLRRVHSINAAFIFHCIFFFLLMKDVRISAAGGLV